MPVGEGEHVAAGLQGAVVNQEDGTLAHGISNCPKRLEENQ